MSFSSKTRQRCNVIAAGAALIAMPAHVDAAAPASVRNGVPSLAAWTAETEDRIDNVSAGYPAYPPNRAKISTVAVTFGKHGYVARTQLEKSSGNRTLDYRAIDITRQTDFPRFPKELRGAPTTVHVQIHFGEERPPVAIALDR
jgi:TonB family protein